MPDNPDTLADIMDTIRGELLPMMEVAIPTKKQIILLMDEVEDLYVRLYTLRDALHGDE